MSRRICSSCQPGRQPGLTLIELLVAITVLSFVAVLGWRGLDSIVRARIAITEDLEQTRGMQLTFAQLQNDCAHLADGYVLPNQIPVSIEQGQLRLIRRVFTENHPSRLQIITYRVKDGLLTRHESVETRDLTELNMLWLRTPLDRDETEAVVLQSGIEAMDIRQWSIPRFGWRTGMEAPADNPQSGKTAKQLLPSGLEVKIQLQGHANSLLKIFLLGGT